MALYWIIHALLRWTDLGTSLGFAGFLLLMSATGILSLLFLAWWLAWSRVPWKERLCVLGAAILAAVATPLLAHKSVGGLLFLFGLPIGMTVWAAGELVLRKMSSERRLAAVCVLLGLDRRRFPARPHRGSERGLSICAALSLESHGRGGLPGGTGP